MDPVITIIISVCMSLLFGFAAMHKLRGVAVFRATMDEYQLIPKQLSGPFAILLIATEGVAAIMVLIPTSRITGFTAMAALLSLYTAGIGINLLRGRRDIDCGCSGPGARHELSAWLVLRNLVLFSLLVLAIAFSAPRPLNWLDSLVVVFGVLAASGLYLGLNQLLAQAPRLAAMRAH